MASYIEEIMNKKFLSLPHTATIQDAVQRMAKLNVGAVGVTTNGELVGIFTERDLMKKVVATGMDTKTNYLLSVMTSPIITAEAKTAPPDALELFLKNNIRHLPVVNPNGGIVGMLGIRDIMKHVLNLHKNAA